MEGFRVSVLVRLLLSGCLLALVAPVSAEAAPSDPPVFDWQLVHSGRSGYFGSVDVVDEDVVWVGRHVFEGAVWRSIDGGLGFTDVTPGGIGSDVAFVDVEAASADVALVLSFDFDDDLWQVHRTSDGGASWQVTFSSPISERGMFECIAMFDRHRGFMISQRLDGNFQAVVTDDGGRSWDLAPPEGMPEALPGEGGSLWFGGDCATATGRKGFFGTSPQRSAHFGSPGPDAGQVVADRDSVAPGAPQTRVFRTTDYGLTWAAASTPIEASIVALEFRTNRVGLAMGEGGIAARTTNGGVTWESVDASVPSEVVLGLAWWSDLRGDARDSSSDEQRTVFAVGRGGSDVSLDRGKTWTHFDDTLFLGVDCAKRTLACYAVGGPGNLIAKLVVG